MSLFSSIWGDIQYAFRMGNMVRRLILVNVIVFVAVKIVQIGCNITAGGFEEGSLLLWDVLHHICMQGNLSALLWHPWTPLTSIFLHEDLFHLLGNMIWLWIFGTIVGDLIGDRRVLPIYLMGGLAGNLIYLISALLLPNAIAPYALGASAAVMAFGGVAIILNPDYRVPLLLLGEVKIKYIVLFMILMDLVSASGLSNTGGHAAHLGGFAFGMMFAYALHDGRDWSEPVNRWLSVITGWFNRSRRPAPKKAKPRMEVTYRNPNKGNTDTKGQHHSDNAISDEARIDAILEKIKREGMDQLTQEEKDFLYNASKK
jgi:membrane associated rhomboid family serine protease